MKILTLVIRWLFVLCLPLLLLSASIGGAANSISLYKYGFEKYNVSQTTGLDIENLAFLAEELVQYFNSDAQYISVTVVKDGQSFALFNEREIVHLKDVKGLFRLDYWIFLGTLLYSLAFVVFVIWRREWRHLAWGLIWGGGLTVALMIVLGVGALLNFDRLFLQFHLLSFANELWQLDPSKDYLIMLFPRGFWYDATVFIAIATAVGAVILGGVGIFLYSSASAGLRRG